MASLSGCCCGGGFGGQCVSYGLHVPQLDAAHSQHGRGQLTEVNGCIPVAALHAVHLAQLGASGEWAGMFGCGGFGSCGHVMCTR